MQAPPGNRRLGKSPNQIGGGKPGPGRPKGVRIKFTEELKQTILDALHNANDEGLFGFVRDTAVDTPTAALALLGRLIRLRSGQRRAAPRHGGALEAAAVSEAVKVVQLDYAPRRLFLPYHNRTQRFAAMVAHRRCGKTVACVNDIIPRAASLKPQTGWALGAMPTSGPISRRPRTSPGRI